MMLTDQGRKEIHQRHFAPPQSVGKPLKDSMHALMRLFLWSPDEEVANAGGVSMMSPAACPVDTLDTFL